MILFVSFQDINRLVNIPLHHPQSGQLAPYCTIVEQLRKTGILPNLYASSRWDQGLAVSYAADEVSDYLGAPLPTWPPAWRSNSTAVKRAVYLRWRWPAGFVREADALTPSAAWKLVETIPDPGADQTLVDVYVRSDRSGALVGKGPPER